MYLVIQNLEQRHGHTTSSRVLCYTCKEMRSSKSNLQTLDKEGLVFKLHFLHVVSFLDVPPLSFPLLLPQLRWMDLEEIHVPGRVFVSNRSASVAAVAGISITSVASTLPYIDQIPVSG